MPCALSAAFTLCVQYIYEGLRVSFFVISYLCLIEQASERTSLNLLQLSLQHSYSLNGPLCSAHEWGLVTSKFSFNSQTGTLSLEIKNKKTRSRRELMHT
jgi:hypothetical protein